MKRGKNLGFSVALLMAMVELLILIGIVHAHSFDDQWRGRVAFPPSDGIASTYSDKWDARGKRMDPRRVSCAHRTEPFGTVLIVTNIQNGRRIECPVLDRGPFHNGRVIDLSPAANRALGCDGLCLVTVRRRGFE